MSRDDFMQHLQRAGVEDKIASFVWDKMQPYYFAPLTPHPDDRPISTLRVDPDDLSDMVMEFEGQFDRRWIGKWVGPEDPTLIAFATGLLASTEAK